jgi:hypothetical protein
MFTAVKMTMETTNSVSSPSARRCSMIRMTDCKGLANAFFVG